MAIRNKAGTVVDHIVAISMAAYLRNIIGSCCVRRPIHAAAGHAAPAFVSASRDNRDGRVYAQTARVVSGDVRSAAAHVVTTRLHWREEAHLRETWKEWEKPLPWSVTSLCPGV